jgi:hypothetical protein
MFLKDKSCFQETVFEPEDKWIVDETEMLRLAARVNAKDEFVIIPSTVVVLSCGRYSKVGSATLLSMAFIEN